ncbi:hypothetical protein NKI56_13740 [Mesorhizobium sp. M0622]|uniref:hypothetical protein n=1 Tax=unclassified Mesorhizobium TaxID=325217 RepID=UPI0033377403
MMLLPDSSTEVSFEPSIDARFPYADASSASAIIAQGWSISLNAAFCVLHELCRPPVGKAVSKERLLELVEEWSMGPDHPLKQPVLRCAQALIQDEPLPWREASAVMQQIGLHEGQRAALAIAYFAGDSSSNEGDTTLGNTDHRIRQTWAIKGV